MKRLVAVAAAALLLGACSSDGGSADQPTDEFLDEVEAVCRDAGETIVKLSPSSGAPGELLDVLTEAADDMGSLDVPDGVSSDLDKQWDRFTKEIDDANTALRDVVDALGAGDTTAVQAAIGELNQHSVDADLLVDSMGAIRCRGLVPANGLAPDDVTASTSVDTTTTSTVTTEAPTTTEPPTTTVPNTPLEIDTTPETDATTPDTSTATTLPSDLDAIALAPAGFEWIDYDPPDAGGLYRNPTIGDLVLSYAAGQLQSTTDSSLSATVFVVDLSEDFTPEYTEAYRFWEAVDDGTDVTTPGGLPVRFKAGTFTNIDCAVYTHAFTGVTVCAFTGTDVLSLLDQVVVTNGY